MGLTQRAIPKHCNGDLCAGRFMSVSESSKESNTITRRKATIASIQNEQYTLKTTGTQTEYVLSQEASHWGETWFWCPLDKYHRSYRATKEKWSPESGGGSQASTSKCNWVRRLRTRPVIKGQYLCTPPARAKIRCRRRVFHCKNSTHLYCFAHLLCNCFCHGHNPFSKLCWLETVKWFHQVSQRLTLMWPWGWLLSSLYRHARHSSLCFPLWRHQIGSRGTRFCIKPNWPSLKILIY